MPCPMGKRRTAGTGSVTRRRSLVSPVFQRPYLSVLRGMAPRPPQELAGPCVERHWRQKSFAAVGSGRADGVGRVRRDLETD